MYDNKDNICILAIESSCDDTGAAVVVNGKIQSNVVATQEVHRQYGGVIPEMASRAHLQNLIPVIDLAMKKAGITMQDLSAVAYARGPGLMGSLLVGSAYARSVSMALNIPCIGIDHLKAHVLAHFIDEPMPEFPFLCLLVSGGHTQIIKVSSFQNMEILGQTRDDAAGEAFDKTAKMLGLPYPGGPLIDRYAQKGDPLKYTFGISKLEGYDFSFSGFKTSVLYFLRDQVKENANFIEQELPHICASIQHHIVKSLLKNFRQAAIDCGIKEVALAGGVSANSALRSAFTQMAEKQVWRSYIPAFEYCTDNAAMIAIAAHYAHLEGIFDAKVAIPFARHV